MGIIQALITEVFALVLPCFCQGYQKTSSQNDIRPLKLKYSLDKLYNSMESKLRIQFPVKRQLFSYI